MRVLRLAAVFTLLATPALAQLPAMNLLQDNSPAKTQEQRDAESARDKAYKESLKKIPDAKAPADPWGTLRTSDAPKAAVSTKKTKTGVAN
jgi:hypothetical protein